MHRRFVELRYPWYWHDDVLAGLAAMREYGLLRDPRCAYALDWLESKRLPAGSVCIVSRRRCRAGCAR
jgi:hypothetical protein